MRNIKKIYLTVENTLAAQNILNIDLYQLDPIGKFRGGEIILVWQIKKGGVVLGWIWNPIFWYQWFNSAVILIEVLGLEIFDHRKFSEVAQIAASMFNPEFFSTFNFKTTVF